MGSSIKNKVILFLNLLFLTDSLVVFSQQGVTESAFMENCQILKSGNEGIERPLNMLQRNCTDCHTGIISYYSLSDLQNINTNKSRDKFITTWLTCSKDDSSKEIQIFAAGINGNNDTLPVKNAMVLVVIQRYFGWMLVNPKPLFTDEYGSLSCKFPDDIKGDETGRFKILIKLADEKRYPNGKIKMNLNWGEPASYSVYKDNSNMRASFLPPIQWISMTSILGVITICIIVSYIFYLIFKIRTMGKTGTSL